MPKILDVLTWPDERLHQKSEDVTEFNEELEELVGDLFATMVAYEGVGLAAPQVGVLKNIIVIRLEADQPVVFINPVIEVLNNKTFEFEEGCLSVPGHFEKRKRPEHISVKFQDTKGEHHEVQFLNLYAFAILHEYDHLQGKVFVDGASFFKRGRIEKKMKKTIPERARIIEVAKDHLYKWNENQLPSEEESETIERQQ